MSRARFSRDRYPTEALFVVSVLWLVGFSHRTIAKSCGLRPKQVAGMVRAAGYENRAAMSDEERQQKLDELEKVRVDDGRLDRIGFKIRPLGGRQGRGPLRRSLNRGA